MSNEQSGRVTVQEGVVYGTGGGRELRCDLFHPPEKAAGRPAVLLLHGGAWRMGDRAQLRAYGILLGRRGFLCAAAEYRLSGETKWPAQIEDVKAALRFLRAQSSELGIDPQKICVSGNSAGGHLALVAAGTANDPDFEGQGGHAGAGTDVAACIAFYAPTKLFGEGHPPSVYAPGLFTEGVTEEAGRRASPITYARKDFPPTLLLHGNRDELVRPSASLSMYEALSRAGAKVELHMYSRAPHGFDANRALGRQCAEIMGLFLERHVVNTAIEFPAAMAKFQRAESIA
jgi:acetyl esterase/lipase